MGSPRATAMAPSGGPKPPGIERMATDKKIRVAIVGLGFGAEFIPIYQAIPTPRCTPSAGATEKELDECGDRFGIDDALHRATTSC